jgi:hypothetical protein
MRVGPTTQLELSIAQLTVTYATKVTRIIRKGNLNAATFPFKSYTQVHNTFASIKYKRLDR